MKSVRAVFGRASVLLQGRGLGHYIEPVEHVLEVERLRELYRPAGDVKLLIVAESHVRVSDQHFRRKGAGFIYEHRYYTPWWRTLLLPAFGGNRLTSATDRLRLLQYLRSSGVWILDASLLSLSGYQKVEKTWPKRPFDALREELISDSWTARAGIAFGRIMNQSRPPGVCAFQTISFLLPDEVRRSCAVIKFLGPANAQKYFDPDYRYGAARFREAVRAAGVEGCFLAG